MLLGEEGDGDDDDFAILAANPRAFPSGVYLGVSPPPRNCKSKKEEDGGGGVGTVRIDNVEGRMEAIRRDVVCISKCLAWVGVGNQDAKQRVATAIGSVVSDTLIFLE